MKLTIIEHKETGEKYLAKPYWLDPSEKCHLFVTDGKIIYCGDCTHELSGQTVDLPNIF